MHVHMHVHTHVHVCRYIDFEIDQGEHERTRHLYRNLLERTTHVKVWISFAKFEADVAGTEAAADVYAEADEHFRETGQKDERVAVLDSWSEMEASTGDPDRMALVAGRMPKRLKKKRPVRDESGEEVGWEEYFDYTFPEEEKKAPSLKILEMAHMWKKRKAEDEPDAE